MATALDIITLRRMTQALDSCVCMSCQGSCSECEGCCLEHLYLSSSKSGVCTGLCPSYCRERCIPSLLWDLLGARCTSPRLLLAVAAALNGGRRWRSCPHCTDLLATLGHLHGAGSGWLAPAWMPGGRGRRGPSPHRLPPSPHAPPSPPHFPPSPPSTICPVFQIEAVISDQGHSGGDEYSSRATREAMRIAQGPLGRR